MRKKIIRNQQKKINNQNIEQKPRKTNTNRLSSKIGKIL